MNTKSRYEQFKSEIHFHNHRYHVLDAPIISDAEYDKLLNELKRIEANHPDWIVDRDGAFCRSSDRHIPFFEVHAIWADRGGQHCH